MTHDFQSNQIEPESTWVLENKEELRDAWESMGMVEQFEEGPTFQEFCSQEYKRSLQPNAIHE